MLSLFFSVPLTVMLTVALVWPTLESAGVLAFTLESACVWRVVLPTISGEPRSSAPIALAVVAAPTVLVTEKSVRLPVLPRTKAAPETPAPRVDEVHR